MDTCTYEITEGDTEGEYTIKFVGNGRNNPYSARVGNYRMWVTVNINDGSCCYDTDSDTYVKYIMMLEN